MLHLGSLASALSFTDAGAVTRVSGDDNLQVHDSTVSGQAAAPTAGPGGSPGLSDSNGTVVIPGVFHKLTFTLTPTFGDLSARDGVSALALLSAHGLLERPEVNLGQPRPGWLPGSERAAQLSPRIRLGRLVMKVMRGYPTEVEIAESLSHTDAADEIDAATLKDLLRRLVDCGQLQQHRASASHPMRYAASGRGGGYDAVDDLASEIGRVLKARSEVGYQSLAELKQWCEAGGVSWVDDLQFDLAIGLLETPQLSRLQVSREYPPGYEEKPVWWVDAPVWQKG